MYVDALLALSGSITGNTVTGQTVTGATAVLSTNTVDLSSNGTPSGQVREIGAGELTFGRFEVVTAFAGLTSLTMEVITADDAALTTNVRVIGTTGAIPVAQLVAGARFVADINPVVGSKGQRYLGARYTPAGTGSAGALYGDVGPDYEDAKYYPSGYAVL